MRALLAVLAASRPAGRIAELGTAFGEGALAIAATMPADASLVTVEDQTRASFRFFVNPGIGLLWFGGAVMALGGVVAAWPSGPRPASTPRPEPVVGRREEVSV